MATVAVLETDAATRRMEQTERGIRALLTTKGRALVDNQSLAFRALALDNAITEMQRLVYAAVTTDEDVLYGVFCSPDGTPLAFAQRRPLVALRSTLPAGYKVWSTLRLDAASAAQPLPGMRAISLNDEAVLELWAPVFEAGEFLGTLRYGVSQRRMLDALAEAREGNRAALVRILSTVTGVSFVVIVLGIALTVRRARRITQPLQALTSAAQRLGAGDLRIQVDTAESTGNELAVLGAGFNRMTEQLARSYRALEATNETLAREVDERRRAEADRAQLQADLVQAQKMEAFGQIAGGVAHDFNNLLAAVQGNAELIKLHLDNRNPSPEDLRSVLEGIGDIETAARRGAALTRQLLTLSRREEDRPRIVEPPAAIRETLKMLRRVLEESVRVTVECDDKTPNVLIDPSRLEQVVMNLAINARDAMPSGGSLLISTTGAQLTERTRLSSGVIGRGNYAEISIRDTGEGMSDETMARVFEPFFTTKPAGKGTGLGLATAYRIVERAGGGIDIKSELGAGTTFRVLLPEAIHGEMTGVLSRDLVAPRGVGQRVLICEDEAPVRIMTERLLRHFGYDVLVADGPSSALALIEDTASHIDLLLTDVIMPEMNGQELAQRARMLRPSLPVLFVSGYTAGVLAEQGLEEEGLQLLHKPYSATELLGAVASALRTKATQAEPNPDRAVGS